jgi:hypothetical protein
MTRLVKPFLLNHAVSVAVYVVEWGRCDPAGKAFSLSV